MKFGLGSRICGQVIHRFQTDQLYAELDVLVRMYLDQDIALAFEDPALEARLAQLLDNEELMYRAKSEGGSTLYQRPEPGSEEWVEALLERLERSDFRLFGRFTPHS